MFTDLRMCVFSRVSAKATVLGYPGDKAQWLIPVLNKHLTTTNEF